MIYATPFILATLLYLAFGIRLNSRRKEREARRESAAERLNFWDEDRADRAAFSVCFDHSEHCCPFCLPHFHTRTMPHE